ncbi:MAG: nucleoside triphosphate pyrophosphohydrolase family protein [Planctomycetaceae bacterium]
MNFDEYQIEAAKTDIVASDGPNAIIVPLLGLAGEVGTLLSEYKKFLRDGSAHLRFKEQVAEDLGDLLWYVSNVAGKFGLRLDEVARENLNKIGSRWPGAGDGGTYRLLDEQFPEHERFPRLFQIEFGEVTTDAGIRVTMTRNGNSVGDALSDNALDDDGYRFHDVFHLSYAAVLGWSPIMRKLLKIKRKSDAEKDDVEDGARARIIEELVSQLVFTYARAHNFLESVKRLDYHLLKTIQSLVADREVRNRSLAEWEMAILRGYEVWRSVRNNRGGTVEVDLLQRKIAFIGSTSGVSK